LFFFKVILCKQCPSSDQYLARDRDDLQTHNSSKHQKKIQIKTEPEPEIKSYVIQPSPFLPPQLLAVPHVEQLQQQQQQRLKSCAQGGSVVATTATSTVTSTIVDEMMTKEEIISKQQSRKRSYNAKPKNGTTAQEKKMKVQTANLAGGSNAAPGGGLEAEVQRLKQELDSVKNEWSQRLFESVKLNKNMNSRCFFLEKQVEELKEMNAKTEQEKTVLQMDLTVLSKSSQELVCVKDQLFNMSKCVNTKTAELSELRVYNSRLNMENNRLGKLIDSKDAELQKLRSQEKRVLLEIDHFKKRKCQNCNSVRSTLEQVIKKDNSFCKNLVGSGVSMTDSELCDVINFVVVDYVDCKHRHYNDIQKSLEKLKGHEDKNKTQKATLVEVVRKLKAQNEVIKGLILKSEEAEKDVEEWKTNFSDLESVLQSKDENISMLKSQLVEKEKSVEEIGENLSKKNNKIAKLQQCLFKEKALKEAEIADSISLKDIQISDLKAELTDRLEEIKGLVESKNEKIANLKSELRKKNSKFSEFEDMICNKQDQLSDFRTELRKKSARIEELEDSVQNMDDLIGTLKRDSEKLKKANARIDELEEVIETKNKLATELKANVGKLEKQISHLEIKIEEKNDEINKLNKSNYKLDRAMDTIHQLKDREDLFTNKISKLKEDIKMHEKMIKDIQKVKMEAGQGDLVNQLRMEIKRQEDEFQESTQKYISNLESLKSKVIFISLFNIKIRFYSINIAQ